MTEQERHDSLSEARLFALAAPVILPLIEKRKRIAIERIQAKFREGSTDFVTLVAELTSLSDLEREIKQKEQLYTTMQEKQR